MGPLLDDTERLAPLLMQLLTVLLPGDDTPPQEAIRAYLQLLNRSLSQLRIDAAISIARGTALLERGADDAATAASAVIRRHGVADIDPLDVALVAARVSPRVAEDFRTALLETADQLDVDASSLRAVLDATAARAAATPQDSAELIDVGVASLQSVADPLVRTAAIGYLLLAAREHHADLEPALEDAFVEHLASLDRLREGRLDDPRSRVVLDDAVRALCETRLGALRQDPSDTEARAAASRVLDLGLGRSPLDTWLPWSIDADDDDALRARRKT